MNLLDPCARIVAASRHVTVDPSAATRAAAEAPDALLSRPTWDDPGFYRGNPALAVAWLLAYNAVNFCYWTEPGRPRWFTLVDTTVMGADDEALGIMGAFAAALRDGVPLDDGRWLSGLDPATLRDLLRPAPGAGELPMMAERLHGLQELGRAYQRVGGPLALLDAAGGSAERLVVALVTELPSWEDVRHWNGEVVPFRKRAQLCTAMLFGYFQGRRPAAFSDIGRLTAFADYRLPQVLRGMDILRLDPALAARIARQEEIPLGSDEEIALRAAVVHGAEQLRAALEQRRPEVDALVVDHLLWRTAVARQDELPPFHRTRTTDY